MEMILRLLLFVALIPSSWQRYCTQEFDTSRCISNVYCEQIIDVGWIENTVDRNRCPFVLPITYEGHSFGETKYALKHFSDLFAELDGTVCRQIITVLDLSNSKHVSARLPDMPNLRILNISGNLLTVASLYSSSKIDLLTEIDLSRNTINTIEVNYNLNVFKKLKKINLSKNNLVKIQDGIFRYFTDLEYLDLSYNFIGTLNILTFTGLENVVYFNLKHNRLTEIGSSLFRFSKLIFLNVCENKIERINRENFYDLISLEILELNSNMIKRIEINVFSNNIALKTINLSNNLLENVTKETFANLTLLENIDLSKNNLKKIPEDLFKDTQLSNFSITENKLEGSLVIRMFEGLQLITQLDLSNQRLESIEGYTFYGLNNLKILLLNINKIKTIHEKSFHTLRSLENLDLSSNKLTNIEFDKHDLVSLTSLILNNNLISNIKQEHLDGLSKLQFLDLTSNQISSLEANSFKSFNDLINFQISNNPISGTIQQGTFNGLISLPSLDISGTSLTAVKNSSFRGMTQLKELNVSHSDINDLQYNSFLHTGVLETMDLSFNKLSDFNINTTELGNLKILIINNNQLKYLSPNCFKGLQRLTNIIMSHNKLESIAEKAFDEQKDVRFLDLSYNSHLVLDILIFKEVQSFVKLLLSGISSNITFSSVKEMRVSRLELSRLKITNVTCLGLEKIDNLDDLVLSNNSITKLGSADFNGVKSLRQLDLSYNKITFIQPGALKDNSLLRSLNVSHNMLTTISYGIFRGLVYLDTVDFSYNEIRDLKSERFYEVHSLTNLIVDHNKIQNIKADEFLGTNLKSLSIGDNPIPCHILVNLKKVVRFEITAISLNESSDAENVDGVTCNMDKSVTTSKYETLPYENLPNEKLLLDIREVLLNISLSKSPEISVVNVPSNDSSILNIIRRKIDQGNANTSLLLQKISSANNYTNALLDRMLKVLTVTNTVSNMDPIPVTPIDKDNATADNVLLYINKIKSDLEEKFETSIAVEKQNMLNEIYDKISVKIPIITSKETTQSAVISHQEALSISSGFDSKSFIFIEVCVVLMLVMLVMMFACFGLIWFKYKNSGKSTMHFSDSIENSGL